MWWKIHTRKNFCNKKHTCSTAVKKNNYYNIYMKLSLFFEASLFETFSLYTLLQFSFIIVVALCNLEG